MGFAGIAAVGVCNFGVSFWLSLRTAMRARGLDPKSRRALTWRILKALNARPGRFLWAPRRGEGAKLEGHVP
jgi:site-specific recombinase